MSPVCVCVVFVRMLCVVCKVSFWGVSDTRELGQASLGWDLIEEGER